MVEFFFGDAGSRPKISKGEFKDIRSKLYSKGFSSKKLDELEGIFRGDMEESGNGRGISKKEFENAIKWLEDNKSSHSFSEKQIEQIEEVSQNFL